MQRLSTLLAIPLLLFTVARPAQAQDGADAALDAELRSMVNTPSEGDDARAAIQDFLADDRVETAAAERGIDSQRLSDGVETLADAEAQSLAQRIDQMKQELVGGDTITISASVVIIVLLVLIMVAVD